MKVTGYLYILTGVLNVASELLHNSPLHQITKPLLMPMLIALYLQSHSSTYSRTDRLMIAALIFSWIGDVALMYKSLFLPGLLGFLTTHVLYITAFTLGSRGSGRALLARRPWILIPLLAYMAALMSVVFPALSSSMIVPVGIYTLVLGLMVSCALNRYKRVDDSSFALVFGGAFIFMLSDSLLAINRFLLHGALTMAGVAIMTTYIAGQYLIVRGMLRNEIVI